MSATLSFAFGKWRGFSLSFYFLKVFFVLKQPYAQVVASGALKRLLNKKVSLSLQDRLELSWFF